MTRTYTVVFTMMKHGYTFRAATQTSGTKVLNSFGAIVALLRQRGWESQNAAMTQGFVTANVGLSCDLEESKSFKCIRCCKMVVSERLRARRSVISNANVVLVWNFLHTSCLLVFRDTNKVRYL